jgi:organic radical activating enzyme
MLEHGVTIGPLGNVRPCCKFDNKDLDRTFDQDWKTVFADYAQRSKTQWLSECHECEIAEQQNTYSFRNYANDVLKDQEYGIGYWDLKINNTCNLACTMCDPTSSSTWMQQVENNPDAEWTGYIKHSVSLKRSSWYRNFIDNIKDQLWDTRHIKFTGGEPLMIPQVHQIIDWLVENDIASGVELTIITNGTHEIKSQLAEKLAKFRYVHLMISIDAIGSRFEYIRKNSSWQQVENNVLEFKRIVKENKNMTLNANFLPQALNAKYQKQTQEWAYSQGLIWVQDIEIQSPSYMGYASLPYNLREKYSIQTDTPYQQQQFDMLVKQMKIQDQIHGTDFQTECPEFFDE